MLKGTYTPAPLDSAAKRAGKPRSHKEAAAKPAAQPTQAVVPPQAPSSRTPGPVNSVIAENVRAGFEAGGAEGEHQTSIKQASEADLEAQRSRNIIR